MNLRDTLRVPSGRGVDLATIDPAGTPGIPKIQGSRKAWARQRLTEIGADLAELQEKLYATVKVDPVKTTRVLLVLQAMDCGGKDGTVKRVAGAMNPQGLTIVGFGPPSVEERAHEFLWRIRNALPAPGRVGVFNRSQYEDVLVARVHRLVPKRTWQARYTTINQFEQELTEDGCAIVKIMLHISREAQAQRLAERLRDPTRYWKYDPGDIDERARWDDYQAAYTDALTNCSTDAAPWYVVPADHKWYRDWAVATILRDAMVDLNLEYPAPTFDVATERERLEAASV